MSVLPAIWWERIVPALLSEFNVSCASRVSASQFISLSPSPSPVPPGPPTNFVVIGETSESLDLSWTNPEFDGFSPIASYRVQVIPSGNGNAEGFSRVLNVPAGATQGTLSRLAPSTFYTLRLFVTNEVGLEGDFAETTRMTLSIGKSQIHFARVFPEYTPSGSHMTVIILSLLLTIYHSLSLLWLLTDNSHLHTSSLFVHQ